MSTLSDWKEILAGAEQDVERAQERVKLVANEYVAANDALLSVMSAADRARLRVRELEDEK